MVGWTAGINKGTEEDQRGQLTGLMLTKHLGKRASRKVTSTYSVTAASDSAETTRRPENEVI